MNRTKLAGAAALLGLALLLIVGILTRPPIEESAPPERAASSTLGHPLLKHMREAEGIDFGPTTNHDVAIIEEGGGVRVVFSERLLEKWGPETSLGLKLIDREVTMKREQFGSFLEHLHEFLVGIEGGEHHDHEGHPGHAENEKPPDVSKP